MFVKKVVLIAPLACTMLRTMYSETEYMNMHWSQDPYGDGCMRADQCLNSTAPAFHTAPVFQQPSMQQQPSIQQQPSMQQQPSIQQQPNMSQYDYNAHEDFSDIPVFESNLPSDPNYLYNFVEPFDSNKPSTSKQVSNEQMGFNITNNEQIFDPTLHQQTEYHESPGCSSAHESHWRIIPCKFEPEMYRTTNYDLKADVVPSRHNICCRCMLNKIRTIPTFTDIKCDLCGKRPGYTSMVQYILNVILTSPTNVDANDTQHQLINHLIVKLLETMGVYSFIFSMNIGINAHILNILNYLKNTPAISNIDIVIELTDELDDLYVLLQGYNKEYKSLHDVPLHLISVQKGISNLYFRSLRFSNYDDLVGYLINSKTDKATGKENYKRRMYEQFCHAKVLSLMENTLISPGQVINHITLYLFSQINCDGEQIMSYVDEYMSNLHTVETKEELVVESLLKYNYKIFKKGDINSYVEKYVEIKGENYNNRIINFISRAFINYRPPDKLNPFRISLTSFNKIMINMLSSFSPDEKFDLRQVLKIWEIIRRNKAKYSGIISLFSKFMESKFTDINNLEKEIIATISTGAQNKTLVPLLGAFKIFTAGLEDIKTVEFYRHVINLLTSNDMKAFYLSDIARAGIYQRANSANGLSAIEYDYVLHLRHLCSLAFYLCEELTMLQKAGAREEMIDVEIKVAMLAFKANYIYNLHNLKTSLLCEKPENEHQMLCILYGLTAFYNSLLKYEWPGLADRKIDDLEVYENEMYEKCVGSIIKALCDEYLNTCIQEYVNVLYSAIPCLLSSIKIPVVDAYATYFGSDPRYYEILAQSHLNSKFISAKNSFIENNIAIREYNNDEFEETIKKEISSYKAQFIKKPISKTLNAAKDITKKLVNFAVDSGYLPYKNTAIFEGEIFKFVQEILISNVVKSIKHNYANYSEASLNLIALNIILESIG